jgi:tripartite-type tricarboxylate transporter receptor subunit TctC
VNPARSLRHALLPIVALLAILTFGWIHAAIALDYPTRPVTIIVPFSAGGPLDAQARLVAKGLSQRLGKPVVVDNRPGAAGAIGTRLAARAAPDGHTVLFGALYLALEPVLRGSVGYDPQRDFAPVSLVSQSPFLLVVPAHSPVKSVGELLAYARQHGSKLTFSSPGLGTAPHLLGEMLKVSTDLDIVHVPYKGEAPAIIDMLGGQISMAFLTGFSGVPQVRSGKLRALGVTAAKRLEALVEVPTLAEAGVPGFELQVWFGALVPARTPQEIITRLHTAIAAVVKSAEFTRAVESIGGVVVAGSPQEFAQRIRADAASVAEFVEANDLEIEE